MQIGDKIGLPDEAGSIVGATTVTAIDGNRFFTADTGWMDESELIEAWEI